jgi:predicted PurR-regulated permease PerM
MKKIFLDNLADVINDAVKGIVGFFKGQVILMLMTFTILATGLSVIGAPLPVLIAAGITLFDLLPIIGSGMIMIPWAVISLIAGDQKNAAEIAILYLFLTVSRQILEPVIVGKKIGVKPVYTLLSSITGSLLFGPPGLIIGPVIAVIISSIYKKRKFE